MPLRIIAMAIIANRGTRVVPPLVCAYRSTSSVDLQCSCRFNTIICTLGLFSVGWTVFIPGLTVRLIEVYPTAKSRNIINLQLDQRTSTCRFIGTSSTSLLFNRSLYSAVPVL